MESPLVATDTAHSESMEGTPSAPVSESAANTPAVPPAPAGTVDADMANTSCETEGKPSALVSESAASTPAIPPATACPIDADMANTSCETEDPEIARQERIKQALSRTEAPIKPEFLQPKRQVPQEVKRPLENSGDGGGEGEPPNKRKRGGMNKAKDRKQNQTAFRNACASQLCARLAYCNVCENSADSVIKCSHNHDVDAVLESKPPAIGSECPVLKAMGVCPAGLNCRFGNHIVGGKNVDRDGVELTPDSPWLQKLPTIGHVPGETNIFPEDVRKGLRKGTIDFSRSTEIVKSWTRWQQQRKEQPGMDIQPTVGCLVEKERRPLDIAGKSMLAPLTTVGNLPFRRLCVKLGCQVTVGEMALGSTILEGGQAELALLRRHESEKCFGVQIAGGDVEVMTKVAQFVDEQVDCDFLDINCGCPLDELHRRGAGSRLMTRTGPLEGIVRCMSGVMLNKPLTFKMRTAHLDEKKGLPFNNRIAHNLVPQIEDWGASAITLHGRTARQRYTKLADWDYMAECGTRRTRKTPFIGCGDAMSWHEVEEHYTQHGVDTVMIGRGALIKPWVYTEIAERRDWDISASERFDLMRDFANFGLEHWGADARGVENTRRFLLEWLSFTCRYVPVGLLEQLPQRINWRPRPFIGRNDLETKLGSSNSKDWVDLTEMLLGKTAEGFSFTPKHKSNSYEASAQGGAPAADNDRETACG